MNKKIAALVNNIPLFFGLKQAEIATFLNICKLDTWEIGQILCKRDAASRRLFILLEGKLDIVDSGERLLATVTPVSTVGEMGFISRRPRSATVRVTETSQLLQVEHHDFEDLLADHVELRAKVYRNSIRVLADRLTDANDLLTRYKKIEEAREINLEQERDSDLSALDSNADIDTDVHKNENAVEGREEDLVAAYVSTTGLSAPDAEQFMRLVSDFYEQLDLSINQAGLSEDCQIAEAMHGDGYSYADLEYAVRWTARNIPSARHFNMVRLSIEEAFKDQWNI
ncbi:MAG: CRP-like cAMP-binding protein [Planctomycetota bacterium]|jgi:CRP-like cAMP-binding protein